MIKLQDMTPKVYYDQSRDFQFIGRLYDIVLNSVKTNTELIAGLPLNEDIDNKLLDLLTMTLGFKSLHDYNLYNIKQLKALCSAFAEVIRYKGTTYAIEKACTTLVNAEGITDSVIVEPIDHTNKHLKIYVPSDIKDTCLLKDLLNYILPAGITYELIRTLIVQENVSTNIYLNEEVKYALEYADRNAALTTDASDDATDILNNKIYNIPGVTLNGAVVGSSNMCKITLEHSGTGTCDFYVNGKNWYSVGEPIKLKTTGTVTNILYSIGDSEVYSNVKYTSSGDIRTVNITKSKDWNYLTTIFTPGCTIRLKVIFS